MEQRKANPEETKRKKAKQMRQKKPIVKNINLEFIKEQLNDIQEACEDIRWYTDSDDGSDSLINALAGDDDEAYEFKMAFGDLCAECERMRYDLEEEWIPECFDIFFVATSNDNDYLLGWDSYEEDYIGIGYSDHWIREDAGKKLKQMTKDNLIEATIQCLNIYKAYVGLQNRYDSMKSAIDVLRDKNTGVLQAVKEIEKLYEKASEQQGRYAEDSKEWRELERYTNTLPREAWIA